MTSCIEQTSGAAIVAIPYEHLDAGNVAAFKRQIAETLEDRRRVIFDFSLVEFIDSSGLGAIVSALRQINSMGGEMTVCSLQKPVRALFELTRMHRILDIYNSRAEALSKVAV